LVRARAHGAGVGEPPHEQHAPGALVPDQEQKRTVGTELDRHARRREPHPDAGRRGRLRSLLVHVDERFVHDEVDVEVPPSRHRGEVGFCRVERARHPEPCEVPVQLVVLRDPEVG
jgi:hypothetical protein